MKKKYYITLSAAGVGALGTIIAAFISSYQNNIISDDRKVINICQSNNLTDNHDTNKITTITAENGYDEDAPISPSEFNNSIKKETKNYISETSQVTSDTIVDNSNSNITNTVTTPFSETVLYSYNGSITMEDIASDPRENTYIDAYVFQGEYFSLNTGGGKYIKPYIEKYIGGGYDTFSATINPYKTFDKYNQNVKAEIRIYADNNLIYTSNQITRLTENEEINIPVKDVEYLKIELQPLTDLESGFNTYYVILSDAILY